MSMENPSKKIPRPQLAKVDRALKLAERWVNNMTKSTEERSTPVDIEGRPARLGLGAAVPRQSRVTLSNDPVERKLRAKLDSEKRKVAKNGEGAERDEVGEESEDEESESRTKAFVKKRALNLASALQANKKQK